MRYLFLVGHPAHVHLFRNVAEILMNRGNEVLVGAVAREVTTKLLDAFQIPYFVYGTPRPELISKGLDILPKDLALLRQARKFNPDVLVSTGSPYGAHVSALLAKPHLTFGDTEGAALNTWITIPFSDSVCTPEAFNGDLGRKHIRYNGYKEIAYLHPDYFTPNPTVVAEVGLSLSEPYAIVRFASRDASHDVSDRGFAFQGPEEMKTYFQLLERHCRVLATADGRLPPVLDRYRLNIPPERLHDVLAFAQLYIGEGATMAAEAGVLGVPWIFVSTSGRGFLAEQEHRYGLGHSVSSRIEALKRAEMLLSQPELAKRWKAKRDAMLADKLDVTRFMLEFIEGWPESFEAATEAKNAQVARTFMTHLG